MMDVGIEEAIVTAERIDRGTRDYSVAMKAIRVEIDAGGELRLGSWQVEPLRLSERAEKQVAIFCGIPFPYWKRCKTSDPEMLAAHVRHWSNERGDAHRLLRSVHETTEDGKSRTFVRSCPIATSRFPVPNYSAKFTATPTKENSGDGGSTSMPKVCTSRVNPRISKLRSRAAK